MLDEMGGSDFKTTWNRPNTFSQHCMFHQMCASFFRYQFPNACTTGNKTRTDKFLIQHHELETVDGKQLQLLKL